MIKWLQTISKDGNIKNEIVYTSETVLKGKNKKDEEFFVFIPNDAVAFQFITLENVLPGEKAIFLDKLKFSPWYIKAQKVEDIHEIGDCTRKCICCIGDVSKKPYMIGIDDLSFIKVSSKEQVVIL